MTECPYTIARSASLSDAHRVMEEHAVKHLPVVDNGELVGVVTQRDLHILETVSHADPAQVRVSEAMTDHPFIVTGDTALDEVVEIMAERRYGSCVVVGRAGVEGVFTMTDACRILVAELRRHQLD